jgi:hypothetical protein
MKKTAFLFFDLRHDGLSGGGEAGSLQSPLSTRRRRQPGVPGVPLASGAARAASLSRAPGGAAESSLAAFHQCRNAFKHHLRHGPQLRRAGRPRTGARHGGGRRHDGVRRAARAAVPDARGVSSLVIARSASDEAIQILAQAALDCFTFARNDDALSRAAGVAASAHCPPSSGATVGQTSGAVVPPLPSERCIMSMSAHWPNL